MFSSILCQNDNTGHGSTERPGALVFLADFRGNFGQLSTGRILQPRARADQKSSPFAIKLVVSKVLYRFRLHYTLGSFLGIPIVLTCCSVMEKMPTSTNSSQLSPISMIVLRTSMDAAAFFVHHLLPAAHCRYIAEGELVGRHSAIVCINPSTASSWNRGHITWIATGKP